MRLEGGEIILRSVDEFKEGADIFDEDERKRLEQKRKRDMKKNPKLSQLGSSGEQNLALVDIEENDKPHLVAKISPIFKRAVSISAHESRDYNWQPEEMAYALSEYFDYFHKNKLKPSRASLQLWLGLTNSAFYKMMSGEKHSDEVREMVELAMLAMEIEYVNRGEQHPTMNTFLLRTQHGYKEDRDVTIKHDFSADKSNIDKMIGNLNLYDEDIMVIDVDEVHYVEDESEETDEGDEI